MNTKIIENFDVLDVNTKRNQISNELMIIGELIKNYEMKYNISTLLNVKNYDQTNDKELDESQILTFFYEDIYNIQQELITLLNVIEINK